MELEPSYEYLQAIISHMEKQRDERLHAAFEAGSHAVSSCIAEDCARILISGYPEGYPGPSHSEEVDIVEAMRYRMHNDPIFHATVNHLVILVEDYMRAAIRAHIAGYQGLNYLRR